jgi:hypothetical protein
VNRACGDLISTLRDLIVEHKHQIDQAERLIPLVEQLKADKPEHKAGGMTPMDGPQMPQRHGGAIPPHSERRIKAVALDGIAKSLDVSSE